MNAPPSPHSKAPAFLPDAIAGISIAGLLLPEAVAYAGIGNLPPQSGLIALLAGLFCYALVGRSRFAIVSATSSSAAVLAAACASLAGSDGDLRLALAAGLVAVSGAYFVLAGIARLGAASNFIAKPVLRGFTFGLGLVIIIKQLPKVTGIDPANSDVFRFALELFVRIGSWSLHGVALCAGALALLFALSRFKRLPAALIVIVLGIAVGHTPYVHGHALALVGPIDMRLAAPSLPHLTGAQWLRLGELAVALTFILYAESYGSVRGFALKHGDAFFPNRELVALGVANLASGLFHGMPVGAGYSATSANEAAGARSRLAGAVGGGVILLVILALLHYVSYTPEPVLAAIVMHAVGHTLRLETFRPYFHWRRDRIVILAAVAAVLLLGVLDGLLAAVGVSLLMTLRELSEPRLTVLGRVGDGHDFLGVSSHPEARPVPYLLIVRPEAPLFFANADRMLALVRKRMADYGRGELTAVVLSLEESPDLDGTSVEALADLAREVAARGVRLVLARLKDPVIDVLTRAAIPELPGPALVKLSVDDAVLEALRPAADHRTAAP